MTTTTRTDIRPPLHGWHSITEIAEHLNLHRGTVYYTLVRAIEAGQEWVKREEHPEQGRRRKWLMNTDSPLFQYHEQRWRGLQQKQRARMDALTATRHTPSATWEESWEDHPLEREAADWCEAGEVHLWSTPPPLPPPPISCYQGQTPPPPRPAWWRTGLAPVLALQLITIACILITRQPRRTR